MKDFIRNALKANYHKQEFDEKSFILKFDYKGASGGNCCGDHAKDYVNEVDFYEVCKSIDNAFYESLKTNKLEYSIKNVKCKISFEEYPEYYGNYTIYQILTFEYQDVFDEFKKVINNIMFA